jgi:predicted RND superfamily exporter protein
MSIFINLIQKRGWIFITCIVILTLILGIYIKNVGVESDILTILPPDDPVVIQYKEIGEKFGGNTIGMVIIQCDSVFCYPVLSLIKELEEQYKEIEGVGFTQSIISMIDIKRTEEGIEISELIGDDIPKDKARLDSIKNYVLSKEMYRNVIVSQDGRYTAIITRFKEGYDRNEIGMRFKSILFWITITDDFYK